MLGVAINPPDLAASDRFLWSLQIAEHSRFLSLASPYNRG